MGKVDMHYRRGNMEELKFRAWDHVKSRMIYFETLHTLYSYEERFKLSASDITFKRGLIHDDFIEEYEELKIMQYIGINDKNNKDIYMYDWVRTSYGDNIGEVIKLEDMQDVVNLYNLVNDSGATLQVVGNRYEI